MELFSYQSADGMCALCERQERAKSAGKPKTPAQINLVIEHIATTKTVNEIQETYLLDLDQSQRNHAYSALVTRMLADGELDVKEAAMLESLHKILALDPNESTFFDRVVPSFYVACIRKDGTLPPLPKEPVEQFDVIIKKDELPHYYCNCVLKEHRVKTGWIGGSTGFSIRVMKGVFYRVGGTRGYVTKDERLVETSRGILLLTNKRLLLHPTGGTKPVTIPISKILSYKCYEDGVILYKEGREKPFIFLVDNPGHAESIGICLGHLCSNY